MQTFISSCLQEKSYLLTTPKGYIVIDPGVGIFEQMKPYIKDMSTCVVLLTHVHFDHAFDACAFQKHGAKIAVHKLDEKNIFSKANLSFTMGLPFAKFVPDIFLQEGTTSLAGETVTVVHTPGHTQGSCCFCIQNTWFTGDTLFEDGGCGRTDFPGGNEEDMQRSLKKIKKQIDAGTFYAGHLS